jgi:predicted nucleic acid-binding protein
MSVAFVLDCSVTMAWLFHDEATPATTDLLRRLSTETALVPSWWFIEVVNVIAAAERRGRIVPAQSNAFIADLGTLDIEQDDQGPNRALAHLLPLCRRHRLTSYDALYLDLAMRRGLPLATLDKSLRKTAKKLGVKLLGSA